MTPKMESKSFYKTPAVLVFAMTIGLFQIPSTFAFQQSKKKDLAGTVTDTDGEAISAARIVLVYKSWPNQRYRQQTFASRTDDEGRFVFKKLYPLNEHTEFLLTVVANGHAMISEYYENPSGDKLDPFEFHLEQAVKKTFVLTRDGKPLAGVKVYPKSRTTDDGDEHFIYPQSASKVMLKTDETGKVKMSIFQQGDAVLLGVADKGDVSELRIRVNDAEEQVVGKAGKVAVGGSITDQHGTPIAKAKVILLEKTWPNDRFQMNTFTAKSDVEGKFVFSKKYRAGEKSEFLVTILANGYAMNSQYVSNPEGDELDPFKFELSPAINKTFVLKDANGKPLRNASVTPRIRTTVDGEEYMIYPVSTRFAKFKSDSNGQANLNFFAEGDQVKLSVAVGGNDTTLEIEIDAEESQSVEVKKKASRR